MASGPAKFDEVALSKLGPPRYLVSEPFPQFVATSLLPRGLPASIVVALLPLLIVVLARPVIASKNHVLDRIPSRDLCSAARHGDPAEQPKRQQREQRSSRQRFAVCPVAHGGAEEALDALDRKLLNNHLGDRCSQPLEEWPAQGQSCAGKTRKTRVSGADCFKGTR
jgi:hypothetical protein